MKFFEAVPDELFSPLASPNRIAACRRVLAQRVEQLEQTARVARHGDVLPEIRAALLLEPALRAQLADFSDKLHIVKSARKPVNETHGVQETQ